jgi:uncharacterized protein
MKSGICMPDPDFAGANAYARACLADLSPILTYHNLTHTCEDVVPAVVYLVKHERIRQREAELVRTAAFFHDLVFSVGPQDHEAVSARMAQIALPQFGFRSVEVAAIVGMILATRLPQQPQTHLQAILADADLDVLGRDDFVQRNAALYAEVMALGSLLTDQQWYCGQLRFLAAHRYFTASAQQRRAARKQVNLAYLAERCAAANGSGKNRSLGG